MSWYFITKRHIFPIKLNLSWIIMKFHDKTSPVFLDCKCIRNCQEISWQNVTSFFDCIYMIIMKFRHQSSHPLTEIIPLVIIMKFRHRTSHAFTEITPLVNIMKFRHQTSHPLTEIIPLVIIMKFRHRTSQNFLIVIYYIRNYNKISSHNVTAFLLSVYTIGHHEIQWNFMTKRHHFSCFYLRQELLRNFVTKRHIHIPWEIRRINVTKFPDKNVTAS